MRRLLKFKRVLKYSAIVLIGTAILLGVGIVFAPRVGWRVDTVLSGSMSPALDVGGAVITQPVAPNTIEVGDIITFHSPIDGRLVTHRVIAIQEKSPRYFQTKGDANEDADPYLVPAENMVGQVKFHIPLLGYIANFVKTPLGFILSLGVPGLILVGLEVRNIWIELSKEEKEKKAQVTNNV